MAQQQAPSNIPSYHPGLATLSPVVGAEYPASTPCHGKVAEVGAGVPRPPARGPPWCSAPPAAAAAAAASLQRGKKVWQIGRPIQLAVAA